MSLKDFQALIPYSRCEFFIKIQQSSDVKFTVWALDWKFQIWCKIFDLIFFLWHLISCQTLKLRPKIMVWKKNQIIDRKIKSCQIDLIWNLLLDLTWFIFAVFDVKSFWLLIFMWQGKRAYIKRKKYFSCYGRRHLWMLLYLGFTGFEFGSESTNWVMHCQTRFSIKIGIDYLYKHNAKTSLAFWV